MHEQPDPRKIEQRAELATAVDEYLRNGGKVTVLPSYVDSGKSAHWANSRMKFTRRDDESLGFKQVVRPSPKPKEMTIMSNTKTLGGDSKAAVPREPRIDLDALVAQSDVARPESARASRSAWIPKLMALEPNQSYFIPGKTASDLSYVKKLAKKSGIAISLYTTTEKVNGEVQEGCRLFRDPSEDDSGLE